ncbi:MAG: glycine cleavage system aminomethyltransferase GcvT [Deltaproteobacteria bacterium]|nr:MAG: glycine cleavage system protein T [Desulfobacteraceae bacterium 4484_190.3]RLB18832.1 MAG: glycine cleavage system aminomethyltransferase GcvT [Deltaproteobacteria bacterium]
MSDLLRTVFFEQHQSLGAKMVDFGGWEMPIQYPAGIVSEHLETRKGAGLFDVSHMGRFIVKGGDALPFLQHVLTNNGAALDPRETGAQYTLIPNTAGGAVDDAYLYQFDTSEYLLVVNASNRLKNWDHLQPLAAHFDDLELEDATNNIAMLALQGPQSKEILTRIVQSGTFPSPIRNAVGIVSIGEIQVKIARTGYTGEPLCFELFMDRAAGPKLWDDLLREGATPVGLGARDTLRLEAGLPLYGHELGDDPEGKEIPILAVPITRFAVSFSPLKGDFMGREALAKQFSALSRIMKRDFSLRADLPRLIQPIAVTGRGIARAGARVFKNERHVGYVTSGTMVPYWVFEGEGLSSVLTDQHKLRSICLAYMDSDITEGETLHLEIRGKLVEAAVVPFHLRSEAPPYARPIVVESEAPSAEDQEQYDREKPLLLLRNAAENTLWRQRECINLIPSEMTISPMARILSVMDPSFRYAEHRESKAFYDADIFYYQGTSFIEEVEMLLETEMRKYLGCEEVETRLVSGQMANTAVFSAMLDYLNRTDRRVEPRRIRRVMNNYLGTGGHLSAQPMGALRDFVARDPLTERPAVINFPVLRENPFQMDVAAALELIDQKRPELIILGKSMVLHREPVEEISRFLKEQKIDAVLMYDMAHVLGLVGPHFQEPFQEGADLVTGSTHKTFFGTQRGVVGSRLRDDEERYELWEALRRRTFPGSVSNHHLGTMVGLLMAAYEMNHFKNDYQPKVISNAKAFARALKDSGLEVAGDPAIDFTETHQVVVRVGYARGPEVARRLEANNIICNYQTAPEEEGFTAAGALRLGVSEMTRFGMNEQGFQTVASLMATVINDPGASVVEEVKKLRQQHSELQFCFRGKEYEEAVQRLHQFL